MRFLRILWLLVVTLLLFGTPVALAVILIDSPLAEDQPAAPALIRTSTATVADSRPASLAVTLGEAPVVELLESMSGVITDIEDRTAELVTTGDIVLRIGGLSVYMIVGEAPLSKSVSWTSTGRDVIMVRDFLAELGYLDPASVTSERFDVGLARAVAAFNHARGITMYDSTFSLASVAWAPAPFIVFTTDVELGNASLAAGAIILSGEKTVGAVEVIAEKIPFGSEGDYVFVADDLVIPPTEVEDEQYDAELRARFSETNDGSIVVNGSVELAEPFHAVAVPITSIIQTTGGSCVVTLESDLSGETSWADVESAAVGQAVTVQGGDLGRSFITESLPQGALVLANPRLSEQDLCP